MASQTSHKYAKLPHFLFRTLNVIDPGYSYGETEARMIAIVPDPCRPPPSSHHHRRSAARKKGSGDSVVYRTAIYLLPFHLWLCKYSSGKVVVGEGGVAGGCRAVTTDPHFIKNNPFLSRGLMLWCISRGDLSLWRWLCYKSL